MPKAPCLEPNCGQFAVYRGRCPDHRRRYGRRRYADGNGSLYRTKRWRILRRRRLYLEPLCRGCGELATDVDHIVPIGEGGSKWELSNLQSLCHRCHSIKTRMEMMETSPDETPPVPEPGTPVPPEPAEPEPETEEEEGNGDGDGEG
jgi:5-methylcytosine-specific restriction protein A